MTEQAKNFWLGRELRTLRELDARVHNLEIEASMLSEVAASSAQIAAAAARLQQGLEHAHTERAALKAEFEAAQADQTAAVETLVAQIDALEARRQREAFRLFAAREEVVVAVRGATAPLLTWAQEDRDRLMALSARTAQTDMTVAEQAVAAAQLEALQARLSEDAQRLTNSVSDLTVCADAETERLTALTDEFAAARRAIATRLDALGGRTDAAETQLKSLDDRAGVTDERLETLKNRADGADEHLGALDGRANAADEYLGALDGRATVADERLETLDSRADAADERLGTLDDRADAADERLETLKSRAGGADEHLGVLDGRADAADAKLTELDARAETVEILSGDEDRFRNTAARVLAESLRRAGAAQPERLSNALSPYIVNSIRTEIRNSRDEMVQTLQPIVGGLVRAAVAAALLDLNKQIENSLPFDRWIAGAKAKLSRKPALAYVVEEEFEIVEILVIERASGVLIARHAVGGEDARVDQDLMSGMLSTVLSFTEDALSRGEGDSLRTLEMTDSTFYLRAAPATILALRATGPAPEKFNIALDILFEKFLERWDVIKDLNPTGDMSQIDTLPLLEDLEAKAGGAFIMATEQKKPPYVVFGALAILVPLLGWFGATWIEDSIEQGWVKRVETVLSVQPETFALPMEVAFENGQVVVRGLTATSADAAQLQTVLQSVPSPYPIEATLRSLDQPIIRPVEP